MAASSAANLSWPDVASSRCPLCAAPCTNSLIEVIFSPPILSPPRCGSLRGASIWSSCRAPGEAAAAYTPRWTPPADAFSRPWSILPLPRLARLLPRAFPGLKVLIFPDMLYRCLASAPFRRSLSVPVPLSQSAMRPVLRERCLYVFDCPKSMSDRPEDPGEQAGAVGGCARPMLVACPVYVEISLVCCFKRISAVFCARRRSCTWYVRFAGFEKLGVLRSNSAARWLVVTFPLDTHTRFKTLLLAPRSMV